jgi:esterase/lipase superfamily enzyme
MPATMPVREPDSHKPNLWDRPYRRVLELFAVGVIAGCIALVISEYWGPERSSGQLQEAEAKLEAAETRFAQAEDRAQEVTLQITTQNASNSPDPAKTESLLNRLELNLSDLMQADKELTTAENAVPLAEGVQEVVNVFYATDRNSTSSSETTTYGEGRGDRTRYGICKVTIPKRHKKGHVESAGFFRRLFRLKPQASKEIVLQRPIELPQADFYNALRSDVRKARSRKIFLYVHGFATSFVDAARRTAQLKFDLGYGGVPMMYSWPSKGVISQRAYRYDETNVELTIPHVGSFLQEVAMNSGAEHIDLIAHSMGNKVLANAIAGLPPPESDKVTFNNVVLTAPDIDLEVLRDNLVPKLKKYSTRLTLYASSNDRALAFSRSMHGGLRRAGDSEPDILVADGLDSVDVSAIDTYFFSARHSYFGDNRTVIQDLFLLLDKGSAPADRNLQAKPDAQHPTFWIFPP